MTRKRALISVYYKDGIEIIGRKLAGNGWDILSTGGTSRYLKEHGIDVIEISGITEFPEILDGRVKTLHPLVFGPILAKKSEDHLSQLERFSSSKIDLVVVNFYPFEEALEAKEKGLDYMVENIDIGGPSMVRAAAKNHQHTVVVVDKDDVLPTVETLVDEGDIGPEQRRRLAGKAFSYTSFYDSLIAGYLNEESEGLPTYMNTAGRKKMDLRYGENPHQQAALYLNDKNSPLNRMEQLQGKELSFNNILDLSMVYEVINQFAAEEEENADFCVVVKHQNPCGAAEAATQAKAFENALAGDPKSAFGGIVGFNKPLEVETAAAMKKIFFEVIIAPDFSEDAIKAFKKKKNLRLVKMPLHYTEPNDVKTVPGGFVYQGRDNALKDSKEFELKTSRQLNESESRDVRFGWKLMKFVKSNGIIIVKGGTLIGVGAGQMSRVDSVDIAIRKSQFPLENAVLVSDAFFPFADSVEAAAKHNIAVMVEPGGSVRDDEVIAKAEELNISLVLTGMRHFRH